MAKRVWPMDALARTDNGFGTFVEDDCVGPQCRHRLRPHDPTFRPERQVTDFVMESAQEGNRTISYAVARNFDVEKWRESIAGDSDYSPGWVEGRKL